MKPVLKSGNYCLEGYIDVPEERQAAVAEELVEHIALTRAEEGCIYFDVDPSPEVPGRYLVSEAFVDEAAFLAHQIRAKGTKWAHVSVGIPRDYKSWTVE